MFQVSLILERKKKKKTSLHLFLDPNGYHPFPPLPSQPNIINYRYSSLLPYSTSQSLRKWKCESESRSVVSNSLGPHGLYSPWNSPGQNTGVGSLSLLQGIFPTQGSNPGLPHCRQIFFYQLSHKGSPRILEWVAYPFSNGSSWPMNRTGVSCIAGRFFTNWGMRETSRSETSCNLVSALSNACSAPH